MSRDVTPAELTPASGLPLAPARLSLDGLVYPPGANIGSNRETPRVKHLPDAVDFDASCPGCGLTVAWHERREDTHTEITVDCALCDRRARARLAKSA